MVLFVSICSIISSIMCILVIRINKRLIDETHLLYVAIHSLMLDAIWPPHDFGKEDDG
jgi:hypothetical protein